TLCYELISLERNLNHIAEIICEKIKAFKPVSGGDISKAFLLVTSHNRYFLKVNNHQEALVMFQAEKLGLETIHNSNTIAVPQVFYCGTFEKQSLLLLEYIEPKSPEKKDFQKLGTKLASLHNISQTSFGFSSDNYIGRLFQSNKPHLNWEDFYCHERILPQLILAKTNGLLSNNEIPEIPSLLKALKDLSNNVTPSLLHGDLWSGNYIIATDGTPYLIDPAIYFGHNEVDIAMSKLFGGFDQSFYQTYEEYYPIDENSRARTDLYQLYYLLVHLNMFGNSYYGNVKGILSRYF
ncbi:MAG: fructosamine kinase family protein, partial [Flavobacteriaceae bacterium]|nr:fructosamine kinase family protein [Flavobacteriaceae bacterium]